MDHPADRVAEEVTQADQPEQPPDYAHPPEPPPMSRLNHAALQPRTIRGEAIGVQLWTTRRQR